MTKYRKRSVQIDSGKNDNHVQNKNNQNVNNKHETFLKSNCIPLRRLSTPNPNSSTAVCVNDYSISSGYIKSPNIYGKRRYSESIGIRSTPNKFSLSSAIANNNFDFSSQFSSTDASNILDLKRNNESILVYRRLLPRSTFRTMNIHTPSHSSNRMPNCKDNLSSLTTDNSFPFDNSFLNHSFSSSPTIPQIDVIASISNDTVPIANINGYKETLNFPVVSTGRMSKKLMKTDTEHILAKPEAEDKSLQKQNSPSEDILLNNADEDKKDICETKNDFQDFKDACDIDDIDNVKPNIGPLDITHSKSSDSNSAPFPITNDVLFYIADLLVPYMPDKNAGDIVSALSQARTDYEINKQNSQSNKENANENQSGLENKINFDFFKKKPVNRNKVASPLSSSNSDCPQKFTDINKIQNGSHSHNSLQISQRLYNPTNLTGLRRKKIINESLILKRNFHKTSVKQSQESNSKKRTEKRFWDGFGELTIRVIDSLGEGAFAVVYRASLLLDRTTQSTTLDSFQVCLDCIKTTQINCALKVINVNKSQTSIKQYIREREMIRHFNPHVMRPFSYNYVPNDSLRYQILMPRARGDLTFMLKLLYKHRANIFFLHYIQASHSNSPISRNNIRIGLMEHEIKFIMMQILSGYAFLQTAFQGNMIRHSDIKLMNILVFCSNCDMYNPLRWNIKLADFGSSFMLHPTYHFNENDPTHPMANSILSDWESECSTQIQSLVQGTIRFNAPEALTYDRHDHRRNNHNQNLVEAYKTLYGPLDKVIADYNPNLRFWGVVEKVDSDGRYPTHDPYVQVSTSQDIAEYFLVDSRADMWSIGVILADLVRGSSCLKSLPEIYPTCLTREDCNSTFLSQIKEKAKTLGDSLGKGIFPSKMANTDDAVNRYMAATLAKFYTHPTNVESYIRKLYNSSDIPQMDKCFWEFFTSFFVYRPHKRFVAADAIGHSWFCPPNCPVQGGSASSDVPSHFDLIDALPSNLYHNTLEHSLPNNGRDIGRAWYTGAWLYHNLVLSGEFDPDNTLHQLYKKEASVLESRERVFWGKMGTVLSGLIKLKDTRGRNITCTLSSHLLGHHLLEYKKAFNSR